MKSINVDVEDLQSAVTYFLLSSKELDELNYRLRQLGNEFADDMELEMAPEYEQIMFHYQELSKSITKIRELYEGVVSVLTKIPEFYSDVERRNVQKINELIYKSDKHHATVIDSNLGKNFSDEILNEKSREDLVDLIQRNLTELDFSNIAIASNETKINDALE